MAKASKRSYGETDHDSTRAKKSKSSKSNRQPPQMGDVPDFEEDLGHSRSVNFLVAAKEPEKRSHAAVSNLKNMVEEGKKKLANLLEEKALGVTRKNYELRDALIKVILDAPQDQTETVEKGVKQPSTLKPTASAIYQSAKSKIVCSRALLGRYERASQQFASGEGIPTIESEWGKAGQKPQRILDKQGENVKHQVHGLLNGDSEYSKEQIKGDLWELDTDLWNRFAVSEAKEENLEALDGRKEETWSLVTKNAQRGVRRTVKYLPKDGK